MKKIFSYITVSAVFLISACLLFISRPVKPASAQTPATLTVCASGTAGAGGCNYIGGDGIQLAIDAVPDGGKILIKNGTYTHNGPIMIDKNKSLEFWGEGEQTIINQIGNGSYAIYIDGTLIDGSKVITVSNLSIHSQGGGIRVQGKGKVNITFNRLSQMKFPPIDYNGYSYTDSQIIIKNNIIFNNPPDTGLIHNPTVISGTGIVYVYNNVFYNNQSAGILLNPYAKREQYIKNNIFAKSIKTYGSDGYGIWVTGNQNPESTLVISYNLCWDNEVGCSSGVSLDSTNIIDTDPKFFDPATGNFRLQSGSPAINTGDPGLFDPDGSASDIGAHGGPEADIPPTGYLDGIDCNAGWGWGYDYNKGDQPILIDFWLEKYRSLNSDLPENIYLGGTLANINRPDLPFTNKNHGFTMYWKDIQAAARQYFFSDLNGNKKRTVSAFGINIDKNGKQQNYYLGSFMHTLLTQPRDFQCNQPVLSPTPTVSRTPR
ncbi:DUF5123 domain-containing protein [Candidatus Microgenomates bacterium]|nr:DUF5123 domain-containing protein [Candidatus Microgenomates bacterium]